MIRHQNIRDNYTGVGEDAESRTNQNYSAFTKSNAFHFRTSLFSMRMSLPCINHFLSPVAPIQAG